MYEFNLGIRFEAMVRRYGPRPAICFENKSVTYGELNAAANRIAAWLLDRGVSSADVVCMSGTKTRSTFGCMLACLKIGAPYSILDPESPIERVRKIIATCRPKLLLAEGELLAQLSLLTSELGFESAEKGDDALAAIVSGFSDGDLPSTRNITGANPAYIMFTSGSTGFPKGAVMTHANVLNLIEWSGNTYSIAPEDVLTNVNPLYFDNSVFDFYSALFNGACLVPFTKDEVKDPKTLVEKVAAAGCTLWFSVPSLLIFLQTMKATDGKNLRSIRRFVFGGEGYPKAKLKRLYDTYADTSNLFNVYGPTECTCICSSYKLAAEDFKDVQGLPPLGYIADNFSYLILDENGVATAPGESGELCLLGPNVGKGYYNDPERTAASFVQNPLNNKFPEVMYRTGDLARLDQTDGKLYIQGRRDNQIKHMGYRIELEEIETALHCLEYVHEAAALHSSLNGLSRIIAIVSPREEFADERIRQDLGRIIPAYMIPSVFHRETVLPKNANGKVDRKNLTNKYLPDSQVKEGL